MKATLQQQAVLNDKSQKLIVSASAGSGKTWVLVEALTKLITEQKVDVKRLLVLTFTKVGAAEIKNRLLKSITEQERTDFMLEQIDALPTADISTIDAFCEKLLKKYADRLEIDGNFSVLDETSSKSLKNRAFTLAMEEVSKDDQIEILLDFKRNKNAIFEVLTQIENFEDTHDFDITIFEEKFDKYYSNAKAFLYKKYIEKAEKILKKLKTAEKYADLSEKNVQNLKNLQNFLQDFLSQKDFEGLWRKSFTEVNLAIIRGEQALCEAALIIKSVYEDIKKIKLFFAKFDLNNSILTKKERDGDLAKALINLYKIYEDYYKKLKKNGDFLDFSDMEKFCKALLSDSQVFEQVAQSIDYVFLDEYQDTNALQASLLKPLAKYGKFVAVGDPKQGIYGFRNADMRIMQADIARAEKTEGETALYLSGNFRSDKHILNFVNKIFENCMRKDNTLIDYTATSHLEALSEFLPQDFPSVRVDIACENKEKTCEKTKIYSVFEDKLSVKTKNSLEIDLICARIDYFLSQKMYDIKLKAYRPITQGDIAILVRSRGDFFSSLALKLVEKGFSVVSDEKIDPTVNPQIVMLLNVFKLALGDKNDVVLLSAMSGKIGGFSMEELAEISMEEGDNFFEKCKKMQKNAKIISFFEKIDNFKFECEVFGAQKAISRLLQNSNYFAYAAREKVEDEILMFLQEIADSGLNNLADIVNHFSSYEPSNNGKNPESDDAITLMSIHGSKGMEFPIVVLAGAGNAFASPQTDSVLISENFGLGTSVFDSANNDRMPSLALEAAREEKRERERVDELMIFYVAMTRAQNHLYIVGTADVEKLKSGTKEIDISEVSSYLDIILQAQSGGFAERLKAEQNLCVENVEFNIVDQVESKDSVQAPVEAHSDPEIIKILQQHFDFVYPNLKNTRLTSKNSVTGLLKVESGSFLEQEVEQLNENAGTKQSFAEASFEGKTFEQKKTEKPEQKEISQSDELAWQTFSNKNDESDSAREEGIIYHEALKCINFDDISDEKSVAKALKSLQEDGLLSEDEIEILDCGLLLRNIKLVKALADGGKLYKEKEFIMTRKVGEDEMLVQGVVDAFVIGQKNILIDYKFTSILNEEILKSRYKTQLDLYAEAIEEAFSIKLSKKYILSLKNAKLIEF